MTSKHHKWQTEWQADPATGTARHSSGLDFTQQGSELQPQNVPAWLASQSALRDPASQASRLRRLTREAAEVLAAARHPDSPRPSLRRPASR